MYETEELVSRIKKRAKQKNMLIKDLLNTCGLNINTLNQALTRDKKGLSSISLALIADALDCSVDYLLGRTDNPQINR